MVEITLVPICSHRFCTINSSHPRVARLLSNSDAFTFRDLMIDNIVSHEVLCKFFVLFFILFGFLRSVILLLSSSPETISFKLISSSLGTLFLYR